MVNLLSYSCAELVGKKEGKPEELSHLTEGSFEDAVIITKLGSSFIWKHKKRRA